MYFICSGHDNVERGYARCVAGISVDLMHCRQRTETKYIRHMNLFSPLISNSTVNDNAFLGLQISKRTLF
ncbi:hypothetical protein DVH24_009690 [Malus domestica]|uniref:Uncharacterized protein n=1 Tax=Malus domestica TaxID=3750 RepID=A0A498JM81_MALDO|nr:hypothetical protein DVH24_009690 [Malus domestica]